MTNCDTRIATPEDIHRWFGGPPPVSLRAIVVEIDGKLEGICGVQSVRGGVTCFSTLSVKCRQHKRAVVLGVRLLRKVLRDYQYVIAYATKDEPTADAFIRHVGFRHLGSSIEGEVYCYE